MINLSIKKLFPRCLLVTVASFILACAGVVGAQEIVSIAVESTQSPEVKVPDKIFALEILKEDLVLVEHISSRFRLDPSVAGEIVSLATRNAYQDFPKRNDILAIIAVESSYKAKALLRGCYGLMQIERKSHVKKVAGRSLYRPDVNVEVGAAILHQYYVMLKGNRKAAILAYNAGIGNYLNQRYTSAYYVKYKKQLGLLPKV